MGLKEIFKERYEKFLTEGAGAFLCGIKADDLNEEELKVFIGVLMDDIKRTKETYQHNMDFMKEIDNSEK